MATNRTTNNNFNQAKQSSADPSGQLTIPITFSILMSESLFNTRYSPASTLILPFYRVDIPYGYFFVLGLDLATALFVKWSVTSENPATPFKNNFNQAMPDMAAIRKLYSLPPPTQRSQNKVPPGKISTFSTDPATASGQQLNSPLFPKGMTINLSASAPFSDPTSKFATLYTAELLEIKQVPGFFVAILTLFLYWFLYPSQKAREENGRN